MVFLRLVDRSIGLMSTLILARLLVPTDFGLVAMATSMIGMLQILGSFSFDVVLIQKKEVDRSHYDTAWTFNVLFALLFAIALALLSSPAAAFFKEPRLSLVMCALAPAVLLGGLGNIGMVTFRKELNFKAEFLVLLAGRTITFLVTISAAFAFGSYWALVIGITTGSTVSTAISYWAHPYRPRVSLAASRELFSFSRWLAVNNAISFINQRGADFFVARLAGAHALGVYSLANEVANLPTTEISAPVNRAALPGYSKLASDVAELRRSFLLVLALLTLIAMPAGIGIAATADLIVPVMLGNRWLDAIPLLHIAGVAAALSVMQTNCGVVHLAQGHPRTLTILTAANAVLLLCFVSFLTAYLGVVGTALGFLAVASVMLPVNLYVSLGRVGGTWYELLLTIWRPVVAAATMVLIVRAFISAVSDWGTVAPPIVLGGAIAVGGLTYIGVVMLLWVVAMRPSGAEEYVISRTALMARKVIPG